MILHYALREAYMSVGVQVLEGMYIAMLPDHLSLVTNIYIDWR